MTLSIGVDPISQVHWITSGVVFVLSFFDQGDIRRWSNVGKRKQEK